MPDDWNHKFLMGGGGGFVGSVQNQAQFVVNAGYATVGTDTGHTGGIDGRDLGAEQPRAADQLRLPRGASHRRDVEGDSAQLLRRDGDARVLFRLLERRTPGADGSAALSPTTSTASSPARRRPTSPASARSSSRTCARSFPIRRTSRRCCSPETLKSVASQILDKCDALDGVKDGVMDDPRQCKVDVSTLTGLSAAQQTALKAIYAPTRAGSETVFPGAAVRRRGRAGRMAGVDLRRGAARRSAGRAEPALRVRHAAVQVPRLQRSGVGLHELRPVDLEEGHGADRVVPQRDEPGSRRVQGEGAQAAAVARLVRCRAVAARRRSSTTSR